MTQHQTDKIGHGYAPTYTALARRLRAGSAVLEIGTADGAGLRWFRRLFPYSVLVGVDQLVSEGARLAADYTVQADQQDPGLADHIDSAVGERTTFALVIDDASHDDAATWQTLLTMWPRVQPGGTYVVEDWNHANMTCGRLASYLPSAFAENPVLRHVDLPGLDSVLYRPGLILLRRGHGNADDVQP